MNHVPTVRRTTAAAHLVLVLLLPGCSGCPPVTLKTLELRPTQQVTGRSGVSGSVGVCLSAGNPPPSPFSAGAGRVLVGFDDFFRPGTDPFPCDDIRSIVFRGGVLFDVSQFDSIVTADLLFDTVDSVTRGGSGPAGPPPNSQATTLGMATQAFTNTMLFDNEASLPPGPAINVGVSGQVRDWVLKNRPNFGFVVAGPRGLVDSSNPPKDNDAKLSWYSTFACGSSITRLRIRVRRNEPGGKAVGAGPFLTGNGRSSSLPGKKG
jgi:hypothetical protein